MDLFSLSAKITLDKSEYDQGLDEAEDKAKGKGSKIGQAIGAIGKAGAAGFVAASAAIGKLTADAVSAYADYEQLKGGVETLFGTGGQSLEEYAASVGKSVEDASAEYDNLMKAQDYVMNRSAAAWDTAGLSANEYMETVTSFSASLIQSLGGDTQRAAEVADKAIIDMSDNANKMGTDMELIQNAYNGFAKGNFMMLDNLKLGYGGTKTEMERLLDDAEKIQEAHGEMAEYSIDSYADMIEAIHVVQNEMGITGTTAKEGASTVSGSANRMKSAWKNVVTSFAIGGTSLSETIWDFVSSVKDFAGNLIPVIGNALKGIGQFLMEAVPEILQTIPGMITALLPQFLSAVMSLLRSIGQVVPAAITGIIDMIKDLFSSLGDDMDGASMFTNMFDKLKTTGETALASLRDIFFNGFTQIANLITSIDWFGVGDQIVSFLCETITTLPDLIDSIFSDVTSGITSIDWSGIGSSILTWITSALGSIVEWATGKFEEVKTAIGSVDWEQLSSDIYSKITGAMEAVVEWATQLFQSAADAINGIDWAGVGHTIWDLIKSGLEIIVTWFTNRFETAKSFVNNIDWEGLGTNIMNLIIAAFSALATTFYTVFTDAKATVSNLDWAGLGTAIWEAIKAAFNAVTEFLSGAFTSAKNAVSALDWGGLGTAIWNKIKAPIDLVKNWFSNKFTAAKTAIVNIDWAGMGTSVADKAKSTLKGISTWFGNVWKDGRKKVTDIDWAGLGTTILDSIKSAFSSLGSWATEKFNEIVTAVGDIDWLGVGTSILNGIVNGLSGLGTAIANAITSVHIPTPHFSSGAGVKVGPVTLPTFSVSWYKKAYDMARMFTDPTVVATPSGFKGFGDGAGGEIVMSDRKLEEIAGSSGIIAAIGMLNRTVEDMNDSLTEKMAVALEQLGFNIDGREFARLVRSVRTA